MATHSSVLAWRIPRTGEPGGLPSGVAQSRTRLKQLSSSSRTVPSWRWYLQEFRPVISQIFPQFFLNSLNVSRLIIGFRFNILGKNTGEGNGNALQYSCLENSMDGGAW